MSNGDFWLAKMDGGWTVEDRRQILAVHPTRGAAADHLERIVGLGGASAQALAESARALPDMPRSDTFVRRFS
jgi:hypothetical protein